MPPFPSPRWGDGRRLDEVNREPPENFLTRISRIDANSNTLKV
jgi:hypothetical protein